MNEHLRINLCFRSHSRSLELTRAHSRSLELTRAHSCLSAAVVRQGAYGQYAKLSAYVSSEDDSE